MLYYSKVAKFLVVVGGSGERERESLITLAQGTNRARALPALIKAFGTIVCEWCPNSNTPHSIVPPPHIDWQLSVKTGNSNAKGIAIL